MKNLIDVEVMEHTMRLRQLGGKINLVNSKLCFVGFDLSGFTIEYVYNINAKGKYFLERIKPYPLPMKEFETEGDVVDLIEIDLEQYKNALKSHHITDFVTFSRNLNKVMKKFEDLFLYYNVSDQGINDLLEKADELDKEIDSVKADSERLYFKKDPENI